MPKGGTLTFATRIHNVAEESLLPGASPGRYAVLEVRDTGIGMDSETRSHLFEPFFTTKAPGKGTGLGLATVYGIVQQCGGFVTCTSDPGKGTSFVIHLPIVDSAEASQAPPSREDGPPTGTETILLVEDDPDVRGVTRAILQEVGYRVLVATDGDAGIEICLREGTRIDLVLTDVLMPGLDGAEMARRIRERVPGMRVLFMSGYGDRPGGDPRGTETDLVKPMKPDTLLSAVRKALDAKPGKEADSHR
jgi:CheY-like chemotaxis protein